MWKKIHQFLSSTKRVQCTQQKTGSFFSASRYSFAAANEVVTLRVVHGSILCDPTQPNASAD